MTITISTAAHNAATNAVTALIGASGYLRYRTAGTLASPGAIVATLGLSADAFADAGDEQAADGLPRHIRQPRGGSWRGGHDGGRRGRRGGRGGRGRGGARGGWQRRRRIGQGDGAAETGQGGARRAQPPFGHRAGIVWLFD